MIKQFGEEMKPNLLALVLVLTGIFPSFSTAQTTTKANSPARKAVENITTAQMRDYLQFIASDEMEGRMTASRGQDITAKFIAMNLSRWGFKPAGDDGTYFQKFVLRRETPDVEKNWIEFNGKKFVYGRDFVNPSVTGVGGVVSAPIVFVGNGYMVKSKKLNPYEGIDIKGKIIAVYSENPSFPIPSDVTQADLKGQRGIDYAGPLFTAKQYGAAGVMVLPSKYIQQDWEQGRQLFESDRFSDEDSADLPFPVVPTFLASPELTNVLFNGESCNPLNRCVNESFELSKNKKLNFNFTIKKETLTTPNVIALWEGSDPTLKAEMVAIGAHYDHVGNSQRTGCTPVNGDIICNGADDDGSGTTALLAIAESLSKSTRRPKRSILFVWHTAEEIGLFGSKYFTNHPTVPLDKITAQLNVDMIGRSRKLGDTNPKNKELTGENEIYIIGSRMMSTQLGNVVDSVNKSFLNLNYNFKRDTPQDPNRSFFRADHFHYAVKGIPIVYWFDGEHEDYHQPGDEPEKIDYMKMKKITRTIFMTMWELADLKSRPVVDKKLPPELTQR